MTQVAWAQQETRRRSLRAELSLGALGLALVLLVSLAWASGAIYLVVRLGLPSPLALGVVDVVHVYVGLASVVFIAAKVLRVGLKQRVAGIPEVVLWQRWISWSLIVLYGAVYATGILLVAPLPVSARAPLVNAHLLASVWAAVPTSWHAWHYRHRAVPFIPRVGPIRSASRFWAGMVLLLLPVIIFSFNGRALSSLSQVGDGGAWTEAGLHGVFLDRFGLAADGHTLVAGGRGLYISDGLGKPWRRVFGSQSAVLGLTLPQGPVAAYVGTTDGLLAASRIDGPYRPLPFPSDDVHAIAVDDSGGVVWASSRAGFLRSTDAGKTWKAASLGIREPGTVWAVAYFRGSVFGSDQSSVYEWDGSRWQWSSGQAAVASLDISPAHDRLIASSMGDGVREFDGRQWSLANDGLAGGHRGTTAIHVASVTASDAGRAYAALMGGGVAVSSNGGRSWSRITARPTPSVSWRVIPLGSELLVATDHGIFRYKIDPGPLPGPAWWLTLLLITAGGAACALLIGAVPIRRSSAASAESEKRGVTLAPQDTGQLTD